MKNKDVAYKTYEETHREWIRIGAKKRSEERARSVDLWVLAMVSFLLGCVAVLILSGCQVAAKSLTVSLLPDEKAMATLIATAAPTATSALAATKTKAPTAEEIIPRGYYNRPCLIPKGISLNSYLTEYEWVDPYEEYGWDCSQMAANIEWLVENCGYEAKIIMTNQQAEIHHAWVDIKIGNKWRPYEATTGSFYFWPDILQEIYAGNTIAFDDIFEVYDFYSAQMQSIGILNLIEKEFLNEWGWWEE